jgi:hypothetical protein
MLFFTVSVKHVKRSTRLDRKIAGKTADIRGRQSHHFRRGGDGNVITSVCNLALLSASRALCSRAKVHLLFTNSASFTDRESNRFASRGSPMLRKTRDSIEGVTTATGFPSSPLWMQIDDFMVVDASSQSR